jgi:hypothetical protein
LAAVSVFVAGSQVLVTIHVIGAVERCPTKAMSCEDRKPEEKCNHKDTKTRRIQSKTIFFSSLYVFVVKSLFFDLAVPAAPNN